MRNTASFILVLSAPLLASSLSSGIKGTVLVREHCGTPVGTPSLLLAPTLFVSNASTTSTSPASFSGRPGAGISPTTELLPYPSSRDFTSREAWSGHGSNVHAGSQAASTASSGRGLGWSQTSRPLLLPHTNSPSHRTYPAAGDNGHATSTSDSIDATVTAPSACVVATATPILCPESNGSIYTVPGKCIGGDDSYMIECSKEYSGGGLLTITGVTDMETCVASCSDDPACIAVAFDTMLKMCYERSSVAFGSSWISLNVIFAYNSRFGSRGLLSGSSVVMGSMTPMTSNALVDTKLSLLTSPASISNLQQTFTRLGTSSAPSSGPRTTFGTSLRSATSADSSVKLSASSSSAATDSNTFSIHSGLTLVGSSLLAINSASLMTPILSSGSVLYSQLNTSPTLLVSSSVDSAPAVRSSTPGEAFTTRVMSTPSSMHVSTTSQSVLRTSSSFGPSALQSGSLPGAFVSLSTFSGSSPLSGPSGNSGTPSDSTTQPRSSPTSLAVVDSSSGSYTALGVSSTSPYQSVNSSPSLRQAGATTQPTTSASSRNLSMGSNASTASPTASTTPVSQACPQNTNQNVTIPDGTSWQVNCAQVYTGQLIDLGTQSTSFSSADDCLSGCQNLGTTCVGFTFSGGTCLMYSRIDRTQNAGNYVTSARRGVLRGSNSASSSVTSISLRSDSIPATSSISVSLDSIGPSGISPSTSTTIGSFSASTNTNNIPSRLTLQSSGSNTNPATGSSPTIVSRSSLTNASLLGTSNTLSSITRNILSSITSNAFPSVFSSSRTSSASTSTTSGPPYGPQCPSANGTTWTDPTGIQYMVLCNTDTHPGNFAGAEVDFGHCIDYCALQTAQVCVLVTYRDRMCFFKAQYYDQFPLSGVDAAIRIGLTASAAPSSAASSSASGSSNLSTETPNSSLVSSVSLTGTGTVRHSQVSTVSSSSSSNVLSVSPSITITTISVPSSSSVSSAGSGTPSSVASSTSTFATSAAIPPSTIISQSSQSPSAIITPSSASVGSFSSSSLSATLMRSSSSSGSSSTPGIASSSATVSSSLSTNTISTSFVLSSIASPTTMGSSQIISSTTIPSSISSNAGSGGSSYSSSSTQSSRTTTTFSSAQSDSNTAIPSTRGSTTTTLSSSSSLHTTCAAVSTNPSCPGGHLSVYQGSDGSLFRLECDLCYPNANIDSYAALSLSDCLRACDARGATCAGAQWVPGVLNTVAGYSCSLKSTISAGLGAQLSYECDTLVRLSIASSLASGVAPVCNADNGHIYVGNDGSQYRIYCGVNYSGTALLAANAGSFQLCIDLCTTLGALCAGVSYTPAGNLLSSQPVCYVKTTIGAGLGVSYVVDSAVRIASPSYSNTPAVTCSAG